jgi:hypothetical protein
LLKYSIPTSGDADRNKTRVHNAGITINASLIPKRFIFNGNIIQTNRSIVITVKVNTDNSLENVDINPANLHNALSRQNLVMTDFLCWVPIILLGFASLGGARVPQQVCMCYLTLIVVLKLYFKI